MNRSIMLLLINAVVAAVSPDTVGWHISEFYIRVDSFFPLQTYIYAFSWHCTISKQI